MNTIQEILLGIMAVIMLTGGVAVFLIYVLNMQDLPNHLLLVSLFMMGGGSMLTHYFINKGVGT